MGLSIHCPYVLSTIRAVALWFLKTPVADSLALAWSMYLGAHSDPLMSKRHLVTAALPYANGPVHIGHIAGCYLPADIYVRFLRQMGENVRFICGSDEHGMAITMRARKEGVEPRAIVDRYHNMMKGSFEEFGISFDIYSRTSSEDHHKTAQDFFLKLHEQGVFQEKETDQYYDPEARQFLADRYIMGTPGMRAY